MWTAIMWALFPQVFPRNPEPVKLPSVRVDIRPEAILLKWMMKIKMSVIRSPN